MRYRRDGEPKISPFFSSQALGIFRVDATSFELHRFGLLIRVRKFYRAKRECLSAFTRVRVSYYARINRNGVSPFIFNSDGTGESPFLSPIAIASNFSREKCPLSRVTTTQLRVRMYVYASNCENTSMPLPLPVIVTLVS